MRSSTAGPRAVLAQENAAVESAERIFDLLRTEKFEDVTKEFNLKMAAALPASQLRDVWSTFRQQVCPFTAFLDERVTTPGGGITAVVLGCQFEKAALNVIIAFDAEQKIGGSRFVPRPAASRDSSCFTESSRAWVNGGGKGGRTPRRRQFKRVVSGRAQRVRSLRAAHQMA